MKKKIRCPYFELNDLERAYHDKEWGTPCRNDRRLFEYLMYEVLQCGLSWDTIIQKRAAFRVAFERFDFEKIARYGERDIPSSTMRNASSRSAANAARSRSGSGRLRTARRFIIPTTRNPTTGPRRRAPNFPTASPTNSSRAASSSSARSRSMPLCSPSGSSTTTPASASGTRNCDDMR